MSPRRYAAQETAPLSGSRDRRNRSWWTCGNFWRSLDCNYPAERNPQPRIMRICLTRYRADQIRNLLQTVLLRSMSQAGIQLRKYRPLRACVPAYTLHRQSGAIPTWWSIVPSAIWVAGGGEDDFLYSRSELHALGSTVPPSERRADKPHGMGSLQSGEYMMDKARRVLRWHYHRRNLLRTVRGAGRDLRRRSGAHHLAGS